MGFDYHRPSSVAEALQLATDLDGHRFIAGGTDLLVQFGRSMPGPVISLMGLGELREIVDEGVLASLADADALGDLFLLVRRMEKPVVAVVQGRALAGGCGLASACDLVLATEEARFGYPEVTIGFVPAMVMAMLRRSMGEKRALAMVATGRIIDADTARLYGLVHEVYPAEEFPERVDRFLEDLAAHSASAVGLSKRLLYQMDGMSFEAAIRAGGSVNVIARMTDDCREGVQRFLERSRQGR